MPTPPSTPPEGSLPKPEPGRSPAPKGDAAKGRASQPSSRFFERLREQVDGEIREDLLTRGIHSTDASHYQIVPCGVVWPNTEEGLLKTLQVASDEGVSVTVRGAATSLSGQTHGPGLIVDVSRHLDQVLSVDEGNKTARVQPGVILKQLNDEVASLGLQFAPDPSTASRATIGGVIGNNSSGARSIRWGKTSDHVVSLKVALMDGTVIELDRGDERPFVGRDAKIHREVDRVISGLVPEIRQRYPKVMRRVAGYAFDALLPSNEERNLCDLVIGSEGTLAVVLEATVRLVERPRATALCVVHFEDVVESLRALPRLLESEPLAIEMLDDVILNEARENATTRELAGFFVGHPRALQIVEFDAATPAEATAKAEALATALTADGIGSGCPVISDPEQMHGAWETRRLGLGLISNVLGPRKGQAFIEDACVPVEHLADYVEFVTDLCQREQTPVSVYGHASVGVLHIRPMLDLHRDEDLLRMRRIAEACFDRVRESGGSWSGEHGDGLVRGEFLERFFGAEIVDGFRQVKAIFDPQGLLNPGKLVDPTPMDAHLRYGVPGYQESSKKAESLARFQYRSQGGFVLAVEQCNGVGACRKLGSGTMCPSYMALRDENHSTRGRANALRLAMSGQLGDPAKALASDEVHEVLDLCLSCKACKSECPNAVDMARLKSDVLQLRHKTQGVPLRVRLVEGLPWMAPWLSGPLSGIVNAVQGSSLFRNTLQQWVGFSPDRRLPAFARQSLKSRMTKSARAKSRMAKSTETKLTETKSTETKSTEAKSTMPSEARPLAEAIPLLLFSDTDTSFYDSEVAVEAVTLLQDLGYSVTVVEGDSQRPRLSQGRLDRAAVAGARLFERLVKVLAGLPPATVIVCLEPSAASALKEDLPDLLPANEENADVASRVVLLDELLVRHEPNLESRFEVLFWHRHCHARALFGTTLEGPSFAGAKIVASEAGCCGMAGAFGYEHSELSRTVAEDRLLPNLSAAQARYGDRMAVVANGFSCRHQLADFATDCSGAELRPLHLAQVLKVKEGVLKSPP